MTLLAISDLTIDLPDGARLLDGVSITVADGETVGLVGESGAGKSLTARAVLGLFPAGAAVGGSVRVAGTEMVGASSSDVRRVRRELAAMIFQDPRAGINPVRTIGDHLTESLRLCNGTSGRDARARAVELLTAVRLPSPDDHLCQYPHEFSGGMLQRVMIAGALTSSPKILVCDEPTTALDVTTQAEILRVLAEQRQSRGMGMLFVTHDLNLAASLCDRVYVMNRGRIEEHGDARRMFLHPETEYGKKLVAATPTLSARGSSSAVPVEQAAAPVERVADYGAGTTPMLRVTSVSKSYEGHGKPAVRAVDNVSLTLAKAGALGIVGESGSGKSTLARIIVGLEDADSGEVSIDDQDRVARPRTRSDRLARARAVQIVFQDPYLSLDPRISAGQAIEDGLRLHSALSSTDARTQVIELLQQVGLEERFAQARPRTLSGGQRQRVAIARALAISPSVLVMDEATSALDVSVQAQVLDLVADIRRQRGLTVLFIGHDLAVVRRVCDDVAVMKSGSIVESGLVERLLSQPQHPYTRLLVDSVPQPDWTRS